MNRRLQAQKLLPQLFRALGFVQAIEEGLRLYVGTSEELIAAAVPYGVIFVLTATRSRRHHWAARSECLRKSIEMMNLSRAYGDFLSIGTISLMQHSCRPFVA